MAFGGMPPLDGWALAYRASLRTTEHSWTARESRRCSTGSVEAAGYRMTLNCSTFRFLDRFACPAMFVASDPPEAGGPPSWAARMQWLAAQRVPGAKLVHLPETSHMMLFERPDECRRHLLAHIAGPG